MVSKGNHPQMAARFRLVKYYNLPRLMGFYSDFMRYLMIKWDIHGILGGSSHFVSELYPVINGLTLLIPLISGM